ncbi:hypothetical protein T09_11328 [Trichinella sp. T9]|nr:hypothetical protein T09_11328 [Trichinella sp. T9]
MHIYGLFVHIHISSLVEESFVSAFGLVLFAMVNFCELRLVTNCCCSMSRVYEGRAYKLKYTGKRRKVWECSEQVLNNHGIKVHAQEQFCTDCVSGKHHCEGFQSRKYRPRAPGILIHVDLCGPMHVTSLGAQKLRR